MNLYLIAWIGISILGLKDFTVRSTRKIKKMEFMTITLILSAMLIFRFGQGTDYFGYRYIYNQMSQNGFDFSVYKTVHGEIGYLLICNFFRILRIPFEGFVSCTATLEMVCFSRYAKKFEINTPFIWVLAYPTLYMTYFVSAIRQGIVISVFLGILLPLLFKKNYKRYVFATILCMVIHSAAAVFLLIPLLIKVKKVENLQCFCALSWVIGIALIIPGVKKIIMALGIGGINYYLKASANINVFSVGERLLFLFAVSMLYIYVCKNNKLSFEYRLMYECYLLSMSIYGLFMGYNNIASRLGGVIRFVEICLIIWSVQMNVIKGKQILALLFVLFETLMFVKNINSYIKQGNYYNEITLLNYKYVSIFDEEAIYGIRNVNAIYLLE